VLRRVEFPGKQEGLRVDGAKREYDQPDLAGLRLKIAGATRDDLRPGGYRSLPAGALDFCYGRPYTINNRSIVWLA